MYINEAEYFEDWRRRSLLLNSFLDCVLTVCIMSLWKHLGGSQWLLLISSTAGFYRVGFFHVQKSKTRKLWINLWINGYLGIVDLKKCILIPHNPPGSLCSPALGTPGIAMKAGSRLAEWLSRAAASHFVSNLGCLGPSLEVSRFSELLWPLPL